MTWCCINCETFNKSDSQICEVCETSRDFSIVEAEKFLKDNPAYQELMLQLKKSITQNKRLTTRNKNLYQEKKEALALKILHQTYQDEIIALKSTIKQLRKRNIQLKIIIFITLVGFTSFLLKFFL